MEELGKKITRTVVFVSLAAYAGLLIYVKGIVDGRNQICDAVCEARDMGMLKILLPGKEDTTENSVAD